MLEELAVLLYNDSDGNNYSSIAQSVEHAAVNRAVVGSSPTRGVFLFNKRGPMVKRLRHRPFTAVTGVRIPLGSFIS